MIFVQDRSPALISAAGGSLVVKVILDNHDGRRGGGRHTSGSPWLSFRALPFLTYNQWLIIYHTHPGILRAKT